jgi:hypothetical protein
MVEARMLLKFLFVETSLDMVVRKRKRYLFLIVRMVRRIGPVSPGSQDICDEMMGN